MKVKCNNCEWQGTEEKLKLMEMTENFPIELCPKCGLNSEGKIMDISQCEECEKNTETIGNSNLCKECLKTCIPLNN